MAMANPATPMAMIESSAAQLCGAINGNPTEDGVIAGMSGIADAGLDEMDGALVLIPRSTTSARSTRRWLWALRSRLQPRRCATSRHDGLGQDITGLSAFRASGYHTAEETGSVDASIMAIAADLC